MSETKSAFQIITPYEWLLLKVALATCGLISVGVYILAASIVGA